MADARRFGIARRGAALGVLCLAALAGCATFRGEIPVTAQARAQDGERAYISPGVPDGVQDRLIVDSAVAAPYAGMRIGGYRFSVADAGGKAVRTVEEAVVPLERASRLTLRPPQGMSMPAAFIWEGRNDSGDLVAEGEYTWSVTVWDVRGNVGETPRFAVVVDNTPPSVALSAPYAVFSPNGDSSQDVLLIRQAESTVEDEWRGEVRDAAGLVVRGHTWSGKAEDWSWDGTDSGGAVVADGRYGYVVASKDRAGNVGSFSLAGLSVDTRQGFATLQADTASFSPNGDGVMDQIVLLTRAEYPEIVERWLLRVRAEEGATRRTLEGPGAPPERIVFDGRDDTGVLVADGAYRAEIELWYSNGDRPRARSGGFSVDTVPPEATVLAGTLLFSPDGDGSSDAITLQQRTSDEPQWEGTLRDGAGRSVLAKFWQGSAESWAWDGRDSAGRIVPDGTYSYSLASTDPAGNTGGAELAGIVVDARPTPVSLSFDFAAFAPVRGARRPTLTLIPSVAVQEGIESWSVEIRDARGATVRTFSGTGAVPSAVTFDGRDEAGTVLPDGPAYRAVLRVSYSKGDKAQGISPTFAIRTVPPAGRVSADPLVFSPDGDGRSDVVSLRQSGSAEDLWLGSVLNEAGLSVLSRSWRGTPTSWSWDGKDADGRVVPDGVYTYRLAATDAADNRGVVELGGIRVDTRPGTVTLVASAPGVSPNGDGVADTLAFRMTAHPREGVKSWSLALLDARRQPARVYSGGAGRVMPAQIVWDGRTDSGEIVEGAYQAQLAVEYDRGNVARASLEAPVVVDVTGPRVAVRTAPPLFSPDGDGADDTLEVSIDAQGSTPLVSWSLRLVNLDGEVSASYSGRGAPPASFVWDGRTPAGELVESAMDYALTVAATDSLGNTGRASTFVPIDLLVVRDGDRLRIVISSIYFKEFTADYRDVGDSQARRNLRTLDRLAAKLATYSQYAIGIEGHAVRIYWNDDSLRDQEELKTLFPLSTARAEVVKQALVERGIAPERMSTIGYGGTQPVVPHSDIENRWRNRRVEFVLVRK